MTNKFFENLLSVKEYNETSIIVRFCFIKIKFPKLRFIIAKMNSPFYKYKKNKIDITTIPAATGQLREIQLANLSLLKEVDVFFKQEGVPYWLDGGTLLGAIRHKGYIPWDDDIDLLMLRKDYEKVIDIINTNTKNPDIYAEYYRMKTHPSVIFIKVRHKKCPHLFVDIFPADVYGRGLSVEEQNKRADKIIEIRKELARTVSSNISDNELIDLINKTTKERILSDAVPDDIQNCDVIWGIDFHHFHHNLFMNYNKIFPLKEVEFEGIMMPIPNDYDYYLKQSYGDYMAYPDKLAIGHAAFMEIDKSEKENIKRLINTNI